MFTRLRQMLLQSRLCIDCERYEATQGFLCVYCHLDARLKSASAQPGDKPSPGGTGPLISTHHQPVQDYASLLPPYIN
jgi:hypothetical protein